MPIKNREDYNAYMKKYMQEQRRREAQLKRQLLGNKDALRELQKIPNAYKLIFGKPPKKKRGKR